MSSVVSNITAKEESPRNPELKKVLKSGHWPSSAAMKIFVEVELSINEIPHATEFLNTLKTLADKFKTRNAGALFRSLLAKYDDEANQDSVAEDINSLLANNSDEAVDEFSQALLSYALDSKLEQSPGKTVASRMMVLSLLPDQIKLRVRDIIIPQIMKHLAMKRPLDAFRGDFFIHSEIFASFVSLELVTVPGAMTTILTFLSQAETRSAALTILGKTVELCYQQLTDKRNEQHLTNLSMALDSVTEDLFRYDVEYIRESFGWKPQVAGNDQPVLSHQIPTQFMSNNNLAAIHSYYGHKNTIYGLAYDNHSDTLVSGDVGGCIFTWGSDGQVLTSMEMHPYYPCSIDVHPNQHKLLICGIPKEDAGSMSIGRVRKQASWPCILSYSRDINNDWVDSGRMVRENCKLVSCIKGIAPSQDSAKFATGETSLILRDGTPLAEERVCYYDMSSASNFETLQPIRQYIEHQGVVTCISAYPPNPNVFLSGSKDSTIRVWDCRSHSSVGVMSGSTNASHSLPHERMVTCIDANESGLVVSGAADGYVRNWDMRSLSTAGTKYVSACIMDHTAVLKAAIGGGPYGTAVSTLRGLYMVNFQGSQPFYSLALPFQDGRIVTRYHDLVWAHSRHILFATGDEQRIDLYSPQ